MSVINKIMAGLHDNRHAAIITSEANRFYATGFDSSSGTLFITKERAYFLVDARYYEKASEVVRDCKVVLQDDLTEQVLLILNAHDVQLISIESKTMTVSELSRFIEKFPNTEFDSSPWLSDIIEKQRIIKSENELSNIRTAQKITERAYTKVLDKLEPGLTERQIATLLTYYILEMGGDDVAFPIIAASGRNSAVPHARPTNKTIEDGEFLILDFGAVYKGYRADMTRTIALGGITNEMKRVFGAVLGANNDALKALRPDISGKLVDNVARSTLEAWGYEKYFTHGLGHGVGLETHEAPTLSKKSESTLREGMVVTVEPGVYIPGNFGVRIEDMAYITADACVCLTKTPKSLICK
ncbi:MAG: Xaa-Pro peptidase family protein [Oscillospiraceae bacterium]|jgi:Xaa-Pro aminopeptidase|nr:Xaa-Pro peptidase family protein [Oscillospiraceae bacterium]